MWSSCTRSKRLRRRRPAQHTVAQQRCAWRGSPPRQPPSSSPTSTAASQVRGGQLQASEGAPHSQPALPLALASCSKQQHLPPSRPPSFTPSPRRPAPTPTPTPHPNTQGAISLCGFLAWGALCISTPYAARACRRQRAVWAAVAWWSGLLLALQLAAQILDEAGKLPEPDDDSIAARWLRATGLGRLQEGTALQLLLVRACVWFGQGVVPFVVWCGFDKWRSVQPYAQQVTLFFPHQPLTHQTPPNANTTHARTALRRAAHLHGGGGRGRRGGAPGARLAAHRPAAAPHRIADGWRRRQL